MKRTKLFISIFRCLFGIVSAMAQNPVLSPYNGGHLRFGLMKQICMWIDLLSCAERPALDLRPQTSFCSNFVHESLCLKTLIVYFCGEKVHNSPLSFANV